MTFTLQAVYQSGVLKLAQPLPIGEGEQVEVVVLKIWEELTFAQIGHILDISPNTVASRYQYAIAKLTRRLSRLQSMRGTS